jgi:putative transposase
MLFLHRSVGRYKPLEKDTLLKERLTFHAYGKKRFGYRRIHILLKKEGFNVNHKKIYRIYKESKLKVLKRRSRKEL